MTALLVLGVYKTLLERLGLRRLVIVSFCCSALAVLYSITACKSILARTQPVCSNRDSQSHVFAFSLAPSSLDNRSRTAFLLV